jgi:hypothetical protein
MNNLPELLLVLVVVVLVAGTTGFTRHKMYRRYIESQESIAESLRKIADKYK